MSDPFAFAGAPAEQHNRPSILELHRRFLAIADQASNFDKDFDEIRRRAIETGGECPRYVAPLGANGALDTEEAIDAEIDRRRRGWTSPLLASQLEAQRVLLKGVLAEYAAHRAAWDERTGLEAAMRRKDEFGEQIEEAISAIWAQPPRTLADLAVMIDLVLAYDLSDSLVRKGVIAGTAGLPDALWEETPNLARLILTVRQALPEFQFSTIRGGRSDYDQVIEAIREAEEAEAGETADDDDPPEPSEPGDDVDMPDDGRSEQLRARVAALTAEFDGPLPEGDAGLIEAEWRQVGLSKGWSALSREFRINRREEETFLAPVMEAENEMWGIVGERAPETLAGIAVKLRWVREQEDNCGAVSDCLALIEQMMTGAGAA